MSRLMKFGYKLLLERFRYPFSNRTSQPYAIWKPLTEASKKFEDYDYARQQSLISPKLMAERLVQLGFFGRKKVLDLGCGFGQWSVALATLNGHVTSIDPNETRISISKEVIRCSMGSTDRITLKKQGAEDLSLYKSNEFDLVFCFGVFMFLKTHETLKEIERILKPGGYLYICTNSHGWWMYLATARGFRKFSILKSCLRALAWREKGIPSSFSKKKLKSALEKNLFSEVKVGLEGEIGSPPKLNTYKSRFLGLPLCVEALARKGFESTPADPLLSLVTDDSKLLGKSSLELSFIDAALDQATQESYPIRSHEESKTLNVSFLEEVHHMVGSQIFHDVNFQPLIFDNNIPNNSQLNLALGVGRCGVKARVLADVLNKEGYSSGVIITGHHVLTYILHKYEFFVLDCDVYDPGIIPRNTSGGIPTLNDYLDQSSYLDQFSNSHFLFSGRNLNTAGKTLLVPRPSTIMNSEGGEIRLLSREKGVDRLLKTIKVPKRLIQFYETLIDFNVVDERIFFAPLSHDQVLVGVRQTDLSIVTHAQSELICNKIKSGLDLHPFVASYKKFGITTLRQFSESPGSPLLVRSCH